MQEGRADDENATLKKTDITNENNPLIEPNEPDEESSGSEEESEVFQGSGLF